MAEDTRAPWIPRSDWLIELVLVPIAMGTVFLALWHAAFLASPGSRYGVSAGVLAGFWFLVLLVADLSRYKRRAVLLLVFVPVVLPLWFAWNGVADAAMEYRGVVEECPVEAEHTYKVTNRYGAHWETEYTLDCEFGRTEVQFAVPEPEPTTDDYDLGDDYGLSDYDFDFDDSSMDYGPESIKVEYDPKGLIGTRADDFATEGNRYAAGTLYFAAFLALVAVGVRLLAARSRQHGP